MASVTSIDLFNALKPKIGEKEAQMLTEFVEHKTDDIFTRIKAELATKEDILSWKVATKEDLASWQTSTKEDLANCQAATKEDIAGWQAATKEDIAKLDVKISETKSELLKWMIVLLTPLYLGFVLSVIKQFF